MENLIPEKAAVPAVKKYVLKKQNTQVQYTINYEKDLNSAQLEAVKTKEGSVLLKNILVHRF